MIDENNLLNFHCNGVYDNTRALTETEIIMKVLEKLNLTILNFNDLENKTLNNLKELDKKINYYLDTGIKLEVSKQLEKLPSQGIDENTLTEKVNSYLENNEKIEDIKTKLNTNTSNIENINSQLNTNTSNIENIFSQLETKPNKNEIVDWINLNSIITNKEDISTDVKNAIEGSEGVTLYIPFGEYRFNPFKILDPIPVPFIFPANVAITNGNCMIDCAKMIGITPAVFTFRGRDEV